MSSFNCFEITFQGIRYSIDVVVQKGDTSVFVEHVDSDDDVEESTLLKLIPYLIGEGFIDNPERDIII